MYDPHPSVALNQAFAAGPFQGAEPERATYLFVGLDANYSPAIEQNPVFDRVPPELITGIITEVGIVKPADSITIIKKYLGGI